jgi:hypothetical protein
MIGCFGSLAVLSDHDAVHSERATVTAWAVLAIATVIMLWTADRWARFAAAFFFGPAVPKIAAAILFFGTGSYDSAYSISRLELAELLAYAVAVVALTWKFVGKRPAPTTLLDRFALTFFVLATFRQVVMPDRFLPWSLLLGAVGLLIAWSVHRLNRIPGRERAKKQRYGVPESLGKESASSQAK